MRIALLILVLLFLALAAYVRFAPSRGEDWHSNRLEPVEGEVREAGGYRITVAGGREALAAFDRVARAAPRTEVLEGSIGEGAVTYVARSRIMGFPDYITACLSEDGSRLTIHSRLRFGQSDLGVNRARTRDWLARAGLLDRA